MCDAGLPIPAGVERIDLGTRCPVRSTFARGAEVWFVASAAGRAAVWRRAGWTWHPDNILVGFAYFQDQPNTFQNTPAPPGTGFADNSNQIVGARANGAWPAGNLKALGTFGFQTTTRNNTVYIQYIPRTLSYVRANLARYRRFGRLRDLLAGHLDELR